MKILTKSQVKVLNTLTNLEDSLEKLWALRKDGSRHEVSKVTYKRVYFENDFGSWSEPIKDFKKFTVLKLVNPLLDKQ